MHKFVIVADDLTGAADCGIACVHHGLSTVVTFGYVSPSHATDAIAIDADTRRLTASEAAHRIASIVQEAVQDDRQFLFKKMDSTMRGHVAAELAATLRTRRATVSQRISIVLAPAFPINGRTTVNGHQLLNGKHLDETELGQREEMYEKCDIAAMMRMFGLSAAIVPLNLIRSSQSTLRSALHELAISNDVLICDAETDSDLYSIAASSLTLGPSTIWAGSAGLARQLPQAVGLSRGAKPNTRPYRSARPILFVIGSTSSVTRAQLSDLLAASSVTAFTISPQNLIDGPSAPAWQEAQTQIAAAIIAGNDVAVILDNKIVLARNTASQLALALGELLIPCRNVVGALVATGGETARAVLDAWGISALRLISELEAGVPLAVTEGWYRALFVITKAGGFGTRAALLNCLHTLHGSAPIQSRETL